MQKKKSPILLMTLLFIGVGGLLILNLTGVAFRPPTDEPKAPDKPKEVKETDIDKKIQERRQELQAAAMKNRPKGPVTPDGPSGNPDKPSILIEDQKIYKPSFNDSTTAGQWYRDSSQEKVREKKLKESGG